MGSIKFILGALTGVAAGTFITLLCMTDEGAKFRDKARKGGDEYINDLKGSFENFVDSIVGKYQENKK